METLKIVILSTVQGITELLPISSSAHILLLGRVFAIDISSALLVLFHLGTTLAILIFFWKKIFKDFLTKDRWYFYFKIILSSIPAGVFGFFFEDIISEKLRATWIIALSLIVWGIVTVVIEKRKLKPLKEINTVDDVPNITWKQAAIVGVAQALALIPGTSRSGISTIAGILTGMEKYTALEYSFLIGLPVLFGSFLWGVLKDYPLTEISHNQSEATLIVGITFLVGLISLQILKRNKKKNWLTLFGIYRIIIGIAVLIVAYAI
ncbi:MAG: undecaprenyl-diphosphate phosphatase [Candidatus Dojkabacteria bacterium]|jgi:undecaprenyl-diphosphatase